MSSIKQLEARLETAKTAAERHQLRQGIAFLQKQAAEKAAKQADSYSIAACAKRAGMTVNEYLSFHGY